MRSILRLPVKLKRRWACFTNFHKCRLAKLLPGGLALAATLLVLSMLLFTGPEPAGILSAFGTIRVPALPDPFWRQDNSHKHAEFKHYLDSLERAFVADSIDATQTLNN